MTTLEPILSAPDASAMLNLGSSALVRRISSEQTGGAFSVVEFVSKPGEGVGLHVHEHEEELVYLLEGEIEVTLGDEILRVGQGACALLPRGIPHGFVNAGASTSRLLAILMPGQLDGFFVKLSETLSRDGSHDEAIAALCDAYGISFVNQD